MRFLDLTLPTAAENLALDEALLDQAEQGRGPGEVLRVWEADRPLVVVGRSSRVATEVNLEACHQDEVPVLRRSSGGAAVVAGPGCLMYAVVLSYQLRPELRMIDRAHAFVLGIVAQALQSLAGEVDLRGTSDLSRHGRKFSGNSLRCKRDHLLYHGTVLYDFPLHLISSYLGTPPRQPDYRQGRDHGQFVDNFPATVELLRQALRQAWNANQPLGRWPREAVARLVAERYGQDAWNLRL